MTTRKRKPKLSGVEAMIAGKRDLMKALMRVALQEVLEGEMAAFPSAPHERCEGRSGYRAG